MTPRRLVPTALAATIAQFSPVAGAWARAAGLELDDVQQEIAIAVLVGEDPARAVPRALRIRRIGKVWRSLDAAPAAHSLDDLDIAVDGGDEMQRDDATGIATALVGGTQRVAARCDVGRRAAQLRVRAQLARFEVGGDLFAVAGGAA